MDWILFILFEIVLISLFGAVGTYLVWIRKKKLTYGYLVNKYGYMIGVVGAIVFSIAYILLVD